MGRDGDHVGTELQRDFRDSPVRRTRRRAAAAAIVTPRDFRNGDVVSCGAREIERCSARAVDADGSRDLDRDRWNGSVHDLAESVSSRVVRIHDNGSVGVLDLR